MSKCFVYRAGIAAISALLLLPGAASAAPKAHASVTCDDYSNQRDAQINKDTRDADGDGIFCEANPCPCLRRGQSVTPPKTVTTPPKPKPVGPSPQQIARQKAKDLAKKKAKQRELRKKRRAAAKKRAKKKALARQRKLYEGQRAQIVEVVDGDTVKIVLTKTQKKVTVRLIGIDTPETRQPGTPIECGGPEATATMELMSFVRPASPYALPPFPGRFVILDTDETQDVLDSFKRVLAYLDTEDGGIDLGEQMVDTGWANVYVFKNRPQRWGRYKSLADKNKALARGVWGKCGGDFHSES